MYPLTSLAEAPVRYTNSRNLLLIVCSFAFTTCAAAQTANTVDSIHDTIPNAFKSTTVYLTELSKTKTSDFNNDIARLKLLKPVEWTASDEKKGLQSLVENALNDQSSTFGCSLSDTNQVYIFHVLYWAPSSGGQFRMLSSAWYAYKFKKRTGTLEFVGLDGKGEQAIYAKTKALIVGLSGFDTKLGISPITNFQDTYTSSVTQGTPENAQNLGALLSALGGFGGAKILGADGGGEVTPIVVSLGCQPGTPKLPFTLNLTDKTVAVKSSDAASESDTSPAVGEKKATKATPKDGTQQSPSSAAVTCTTDGNSTPCTSTHTFVSTDREWWDVSIGVTTPGIRETKYSFSNSSVQTSVTRHTDLYALFDFFPAARRQPKDGIIPHLNVGLPLTSQSFYRPYFGVAENLTGWTTAQRNFSLPVGVNFYVGMIYMKTNYLIGSPTTQAEFNTALKPTRVWKVVYGIEVPIGSMVSKIGSKGSSKK
jgi:hypothetical protein